MDREKLKEKYGDEKVLVVEQDLIKSEGFVRQTKKEILENIVRNSFSMDRSEVEYNDRYRQLVVYCPVLVGLEKDPKIFLTVRTDSRNRLYNKLDLGIGGHINSADRSIGVNQVIESAIAREVEEELSGLGAYDYSLDIIGTIATDKTSLEREHLAIVATLVSPTEDISIAEPEMEGWWERIEDLFARHYRHIYLKRTDPWSEIMFDILEEELRETYKHF